MGHSHMHTLRQTHTLGGQGSPGKALVTVHPSVLLLSHVKTECGLERRAQIAELENSKQQETQMIVKDKL